MDGNRWLETNDLVVNRNILLRYIVVVVIRVSDHLPLKEN